MFLVKAISRTVKTKGKILLQPILSDLPPPYNPHRSENRIILLLASTIVTILIFVNLVTTTSTSSSSKYFVGSSSSNTNSNTNNGGSRSITIGTSTMVIDSHYSLAYRESLGFFHDIPNDVWMEKKKRVKSQPRHNDAKLGLRSKFANRERASTWYQNNWEAEFTCPHERRIGGSGDGAKWTCDPHRIQAIASLRQQQEQTQQQKQQPQPQLNDNDTNDPIKITTINTNNPTNPCLIYSIGHHGKRPQHVINPNYFDFSYEQSLLTELGGSSSSSNNNSQHACEIHIFDSWLATYRGPSPPGLILHPWGLEGVADAHLGRRDYMTLGETVERLGHGGREVDVFKVDCEACEWHTFREWFDHSDGSNGSDGGSGGGVVMRQILVELHGAPKYEDDFFETMEKNHFVIFHREADTQYA